MPPVRQHPILKPMIAQTTPVVDKPVKARRTRSKDKLTPTQVKCLKTLGSSIGWSTRAQLASRIGLNDPAILCVALGSTDAKARHIAETKRAKGRLSLISLGLAVGKDIDTEGRIEQCYKITDKGREVLKQITSSE